MINVQRNNIFRLTSFFLLVHFAGLCQKASVYFRNNSFLLDHRARIVLDSLLKTNSIEKIYLQGHCDFNGSNAFNDALSMKRVREVKSYIVSYNIPSTIIEIKAYGKKAQLNTNKTERERSLNRRVEIEIIKKKPVSETNIDTTNKVTGNEPAKDEVQVTINGVVVNEKRKPLIAEVTLSDMNGTEIVTTTSGKDGKYQITTTVKKNDSYSLTYYNDSSFTSSRIVNISNPKQPYKNLRTVLRTLKGGRKYVVENLNFESDTSQLVSTSVPSLEALYKLMKRNHLLVIRIEGHINYPNSWPNPKKPVLARRWYPSAIKTREEFNQWLSEERAKMVYNFLVKKGIKPNRMSIIGYGAGKMLFPDALNESEMSQNRRVEINVISLK